MAILIATLLLFYLLAPIVNEYMDVGQYLLNLMLILITSSMLAFNIWLWGALVSVKAMNSEIAKKLGFQGWMFEEAREWILNSSFLKVEKSWLEEEGKVTNSSKIKRESGIKSKPKKISPTKSP